MVCVINLFYLFKNRETIWNSYEYQVNVYVDDVHTCKMKATIREIQRCKSHIITPIQQLYKGEGRITLELEELQSTRYERVAKRYKIIFMYFLSPSKEQKNLYSHLSGNTHERINSLAWSLWTDYKPAEFPSTSATLEARSASMLSTTRNDKDNAEEQKLLERAKRFEKDSLSLQKKNIIEEEKKKIATKSSIDNASPSEKQKSIKKEDLMDSNEGTKRGVLLDRLESHSTRRQSSVSSNEAVGQQVNKKLSSSSSDMSLASSHEAQSVERRPTAPDSPLVLPSIPTTPLPGIPARKEKATSPIAAEPCRETRQSSEEKMLKEKGMSTRDVSVSDRLDKIVGTEDIPKEMKMKDAPEKPVQGLGSSLSQDTLLPSLEPVSFPKANPTPAAIQESEEDFPDLRMNQIEDLNGAEYEQVESERIDVIKANWLKRKVREEEEEKDEDEKVHLQEVRRLKYVEGRKYFREQRAKLAADIEKQLMLREQEEVAAMREELSRISLPRRAAYFPSRDPRNRPSPKKSSLDAEAGQTSNWNDSNGQNAPAPPLPGEIPFSPTSIQSSHGTHNESPQHNPQSSAMFTPASPLMGARSALPKPKGIR